MHKIHKNYCHSREPKEGEIVIVKEDNVPWKPGKIMHLISNKI